VTKTTKLAEFGFIYSVSSSLHLALDIVVISSEHGNICTHLLFPLRKTA